MITFIIAAFFLLAPFILALLYLYASLIRINRLTRYILYQRDYVNPKKDIQTARPPPPTTPPMTTTTSSSPPIVNAGFYMTLSRPSLQVVMDVLVRLPDHDRTAYTRAIVPLDPIRAII